MLYNKDRLDTAYSNVALIADGAWSVSNDYVRANQELLINECRFQTRMGLKRSVLDTIPESRLAQYGIYFYDEMRESCYNSIDNFNSEIKIDVFSKDEAWMTEEVDKIFQLMNNPHLKVHEIEMSCSVILKELEDNKVRMNDTDFLLDNNLSIDDGRDSFNLRLRQLWDSNQNNNQNIPSNSSTVLNADVPEFYPKQTKNNQNDFYLTDNVGNDTNTPATGYSGLSNYQRQRRDYSFNSSSVSIHSPLYEPWINYGYPVRAHEFRSLDSLVDGLRALPIPLTPLVLPTSPQTTTMPQMSGTLPTRRLYSAVLQNSPSSTVDEDDLERQAMEQYRRSEETIAAQFQELERLAEEQYNGGHAPDANSLTSNLNKASQTQLTVPQVPLRTPTPSTGNGTSPRRKPAPCTVGRQPYCPALAAQLFANTLFTLARLKFMRMGARLPHALI